MKLARITFGGTALLVMTACTVSVTSPPTTTRLHVVTLPSTIESTTSSTTTTSTTTTIAAPTPLEGLTLEEARIWEGGILRISGPKIAAFADLVCNGLRNGETGSSLLDLGMKAVASRGGTDVDVSYMARMIGATVRWMCPDMADRAKI